MKVSIIIPTYKPQDYIWDCLDSIVAQTFPKNEFEVIIVLNGCCSPWREQIQDYIDNNMEGINVNFIQTDIAGVSSARNIGLDIAKGDYITFIDDDDFISPKYLEGLYKIVDSDTVSLCYPYAFNDGYPEIQIKDYALNAVYNQYCSNKRNRIASKVRKYFSGPWMKLIPKNIIQDLRFDHTLKVGEDTLFMFLISKNIKHLVFSDTDAVYYRRNREGSAINQGRSKRFYVQTNIHQISVYCRAYIQDFTKYNLLFFLSRVAAAVKSLFIKLFEL